MNLPFLLAVAALLLGHSVSRADQIHVPGDHPTIQAGIDAADDGDEVIVAPGTYEELIDLGTKAITIRSTDPSDPGVVSATIIDGNGLGPVVTCTQGQGPSTVLSGFFITGGVAPLGGGMAILGSSPTVTLCIFEGNEALTSGGGVYCMESAPTFAECTFQNNEAPLGSGGGMYAELSTLSASDCAFVNNISRAGGGIFDRECDVTLSDCDFVGNSAIDSGGGMRSRISSVVLTHCSFLGNEAPFGGGRSQFRGDSYLLGCLFQDNTASTAGGGAYNNRTETVFVDCTLVDNRAGGVAASRPRDTFNLFDLLGQGSSGNTRGGAISNENGTTSEVIYCVLSGNFGGIGGAIHNQESPATISDNLISHNSTTNSAFAAIHCRADSDAVTSTVARCTISDNAGTGVRAWGGSFRMEDCTLSRNLRQGLFSTEAIPVGILNMVERCVFQDNGTNGMSIRLVGRRLFRRLGVRSSVFRSNGGWGLKLDLGDNWPDMISCRFEQNGRGGVETDNAQGTIAESRFHNCTFIENERHGIDHGDGVLDVINSTFLRNRDTAVVSAGFRPRLLNSIFRGNLNGTYDYNGSDITVEYCNFPGAVGLGEGNIDRRPRFADSEGRLKGGSPCIDAGRNDYVPGSWPDLDDNPRFVDEPDVPDTGDGDAPVVDMGAYEYQE